MEKSTVRRWAWPLGSFLAAVGFELTPIEAPGVATAFWIAAVAVLLIAAGWNTAPVVAIRCLFAVPWPLGGRELSSQAATDTEITFHPDMTERGNALVGIRNSGLDGEFEVTGEVLKVTGDPNPERRMFFKGCWLETDAGIMQIGTDQTRQLKVGEYYIEDREDEHGLGRLHRLDLIRQEAGGCEPWEWFRWHGRDADEERPEIRLEITINRLNSNAPPVSERFLVRTHKYGGVSVIRSGRHG